MGKVLEIYNRIIERLEAANVTGGLLADFGSITGGFRPKTYEPKSMPSIVVTMGGGSLDGNNQRDVTASQSITVEIMANSASASNRFFNSTTEKGIIVDKENVINAIFSDYDLGCVANERIDIDWDYEELDNGFVRCTLTIDVISLPFGPGGL